MAVVHFEGDSLENTAEALQILNPKGYKDAASRAEWIRQMCCRLERIAC